MAADKPDAVKLYLVQVKVLTALATTLLLAPNVLLSLIENDNAQSRLAVAFPSWKDSF